MGCQEKREREREREKVNYPGRFDLLCIAFRGLPQASLHLIKFNESYCGTSTRILLRTVAKLSKLMFFLIRLYVFYTPNL